MNRAEITASLSELVRKRLENRSIFWAAEVNLDAHKKRVDFVGFNPSKNGNFANIAEIESGTFDFYEVKSSMADFNSGHGKNWEGDKTFLFVKKTWQMNYIRRCYFRIVWMCFAPTNLELH